MTWRRLKRLCTDAGQYGLNVPAEDYVEAGEGVRLIRTTDLAGGHLQPDSEGIFVPGPVPKPFILESGDILLSRSGTIGRSFLVPGEIAGLTFAGFLVRFRPRGDQDARYISYALQSEHAQAQVQADAIVSTIQNFNAERYANLALWVPPFPDQRRIADFLDDQVALLDQAVELRQAQSRLLQDRLQALIDHVGDGSFSRWGLRDRPRSVKAGRLLRVLPGYAFPSNEFSVDEGTPLLRGINVGIRQINWEDVLSWEPGDQRVLRAFSLRLGDVVMGMDRPWINGGLRIARIGKEDLPSLLLQRVACLRPGPELDAEYMYWAYQTRRFREEVEGMLTGLSVPHLSGEQISSYQVFLPPTAVQLRVASDLALAGADIANAVSLAGRQIGLLQERKRSLITAAVTGEFDVTTARRVA